MANQTRNIVILCAAISVVMFGMGVIIGYFNGETATTGNRPADKDDITSRPGSCSNRKWSEDERTHKLSMASAARAKTLTSTSQLHEYISSGRPDLIILDSTHLPVKDDVPNFLQHYEESHIPNAHFFDGWRCVDGTDLNPLYVPKDCFEDYVKSLGISADTHIVLYDNLGQSIPAFQNWAAFRTLWLFRFYGHRNVTVLDGGFPKWIKDGYSNSTEIPQVQPATTFEVNFDSSKIFDYDTMLQTVVREHAQVIDSRMPEHLDILAGFFSQSYHDGLLSLFRSISGLRVLSEHCVLSSVTENQWQGENNLNESETNGGYIPCAYFLPFVSFFTEEGTVRPSHHLFQLVTTARVDLDKPMVAMCNQGYAASSLAGLMQILGVDIPVYHGSWQEWVVRADEKYKMRILPLETD